MLKGKGIYCFLPFTSPPIQLFHLLQKMQITNSVKSDHHGPAAPGSLLSTFLAPDPHHQVQGADAELVARGGDTPIPQGMGKDQTHSHNVPLLTLLSVQNTV